MYGGLLTTSASWPHQARSGSHQQPSNSCTCPPAPACSRLKAAWRRASELRSTAQPRLPGQARASARATQPEPVPRSAQRAGLGAASSSAHSTRISVSWRGINTPGPTASSRSRQGQRPTRYCRGSWVWRWRCQSVSRAGKSQASATGWWGWSRSCCCCCQERPPARSTSQSRSAGLPPRASCCRRQANHCSPLSCLCPMESG